MHGSLFPGPAQFSIAYSTVKLGGAWERGYVHGERVCAYGRGRMVCMGRGDVYLEGVECVCMGRGRVWHMEGVSACIGRGRVCAYGRV